MIARSFLCGGLVTDVQAGSRGERDEHFKAIGPQVFNAYVSKLRVPCNASKQARSNEFGRATRNPDQRRLDT